MLCYRVKSVGDEIEVIFIKHFGNIYRFSIDSKSANGFHKRFSRFSLRRWLKMGISVGRVYDYNYIFPSDGITEIKTEDLAKIMERGSKYKFNLNLLEDITYNGSEDS